MTLLPRERERARAEFQDREKKEEEVHFDQSKVRSEIRVREGRAKPIDVLCRLSELKEPYLLLRSGKTANDCSSLVVIKELTVKEMEELRVDIKMKLDLNRANPTRVHWEEYMVACDWELAEARKREEPPAELLAQERGLHADVEEEEAGSFSPELMHFSPEVLSKSENLNKLYFNKVEMQTGS